MCGVETGGAVLATLLPFVAVVLLFIFAFRWRKRQRGTPAVARTDSTSRARATAFLVAILLVTVLLNGWMRGWSFESLLLPVGWLLSGAVLFLVDRFLDRRLRGSRPKVIGPIPFWWTFVWALALGFGSAMVTIGGSPWPVWVQVVVFLVLVLAAVAAFCFRFGLRLRG